MVNKSEYSKTKAKCSLKVKRNVNGDVVSSTFVETSVWTKRLVRMEGMNMCKKKELMPILAEVIKSNIDMKLTSYMLANQNQKSFVKTKSGDPMTVQKLAVMFDVTDRKVRGLIKELEEQNLIKRHNKKIFINPFIQLPYGNNKDDNFIVQMMWKNNYELTEEQLLEVHSTEMLVNREVEL